MTSDQYRREGAEAMRAYIANGCDPSHLSRSDNPTEFHAGYRHAAIQRFTAIRAIDVDEVLAGMPPAPDAVARLVEAARALGAMPEGYCFCSANRVGDDSKIHEPECADLRAALVAKENEQCQVSIGPAIGATINGLHGSGAGAPDAVDNSYTDDLIDLIGEFGREVYYLLDDCETSGPVGEEIHTITEDGLRKVSAILDRIDALPFGEPGVMLGTGAMLQAAIMQTFAHPPQPSETVTDVTRAMVDAAFGALPPDAHGTIGPGEMERVLKAALKAYSRVKVWEGMHLAATSAAVSVDLIDDQIPGARDALL